VNIFITGSAGFIGTHLVETFLGQGHHVIGVDNYISGQPENTELFIDHPHFEFVNADVSQPLAHSRHKLDWVLHFASPASPIHYQQHPIETLMVGAQGTQHCLDLCRAHDAKFLLASTSEVYGDPQVSPQPETYWGNVNPNGVRSCYDEAKRYAEALTMAYHRSCGVNTRIIRIFNTYGPRMRPNDGRVITNLIQQAITRQPLTIYGDGSQTRSFQYIDDLISGIVNVMGVAYHDPINLGNPSEVNMLELVGVLERIFDRKMATEFRALPSDDPQQRKPDITLARTLTNWEPQISLAQGLKYTLESLKR
jgi:nucleoside-diphosphate-sugar epimerase